MCACVCVRARVSTHTQTATLQTKSTGQLNLILLFSNMLVDTLAYTAINLTC